MERINVSDILKKHIGSRDIYDEKMQAAIKEIAEAIVDKCGQEAEAYNKAKFPGDVNPQVDIDSILQVKQLIDY